MRFSPFCSRSIPVENFEDHSAPPSPDEKDSGFFMLRKDSERRATLHHILTEDGDKVVANLMEALAQVGGGEKTANESGDAPIPIPASVLYLYLQNMCRDHKTDTSCVADLYRVVLSKILIYQKKY